MLSSLEITTGMLIIVSAALIQGMTGFGFGLMTVPFLSVIISPKTAVPVVLIYTVIISGMVLKDAYKSVDMKWMLPLLIAGLAGLYPGVVLLKTLDNATLRIYIGCVITIFAILLLIGYTERVKNERRAFLPVGFISGILSGSISVGGPPVILFFSNQAVGKNRFRANLTVYFFILNSITVPVYFAAGLFNEEVANCLILFLPGVVIGTLTGILLSKKVNEKLFRRIALVIVALGGISAVVAGIEDSIG